MLVVMASRANCSNKRMTDNGWPWMSLETGKTTNVIATLLFGILVAHQRGNVLYDAKRKAQYY